MIYFIASAGILILLIGYIISTYNRLVSNKNSLDESFSTMDVYLKKRWDLIPNLVETVKGYAKHEKNLFKDSLGKYGSLNIYAQNLPIREDEDAPDPVPYIIVRILDGKIKIRGF